MKKLNLELDRLAVESFETADGGAKARGTVRGHFSGPTQCATYCGAECPSGPYRCEGSNAWTNGIAACKCMDTGETGDVC